jgi:hypothetical protein
MYTFICDALLLLNKSKKLITTHPRPHAPPGMSQKNSNNEPWRTESPIGPVLALPHPRQHKMQLQEAIYRQTVEQEESGMFISPLNMNNAALSCEIPSHNTFWRTKMESNDSTECNISPCLLLFFSTMTVEVDRHDWF